jgi:hypothetical protein
MKDKLPFGRNCKQIWLPNGTRRCFQLWFLAAAVYLLPFLEFYADPANDCKFLREDIQTKIGLWLQPKLMSIIAKCSG